VPCCLKTGLYLSLDSMRLPDDVQYAFLCGSMAKSFGADRVASLDPRVTPRAIVLSGGEHSNELTSRGGMMAEEAVAAAVRSSAGGRMV
jgi:hypothetical protein